MTFTRHQRSPLGAFYRSPLGAFGPGVAEEIECLLGEVNTQIDDATRSYGIYTLTALCEFRADTDPPIGNLFTSFVFDAGQDAPASNGIWSYWFTGVSSGAQFRPIDLTDQFYCLQSISANRIAKLTFGTPYVGTNDAEIYQHQINDRYNTSGIQGALDAVTNYGRFPGAEVNHPTDFLLNERFYACPGDQPVVLIGQKTNLNFPNSYFAVNASDCTSMMESPGFATNWRERIIFQNADMPAGFTQSEFRALVFRTSEVSPLEYRPATDTANYFCGDWDSPEGVKHGIGIVESIQNPGYFLATRWEHITRGATETVMDIWNGGATRLGSDGQIVATEQ